MSASETARENAQQALIEAYAKLLICVTKMHELANAEQWAELIEQRTHYVMSVEALRKHDEETVLDDDGRRQKTELLESILEHDVEIRRRLVARRDELGKLIGVSQRQRSLHRAYAPQQANATLFDNDQEEEAT
ncbi:flagellar protein FliT [Vreelandella venusta]|uniref:Flagellar protein FliT n=1 Tax=Vreelandella venusta TaxID=44935 RepID=A0AAP9ZD90_9GAMM|nr:flagellar protein FliT [Halomonas venusta]MBR9924505.1 flagellar protein FliT [Gammaproteobacteria bacterium]MDW0359176.1 flagellar protein FliT [Halomonas venusta]MDX1712812.1 flagellar protein FliT [Halomonas venusta]QPI64256.1 flagellar protein FliT [Halomonas venusta]QRL03496.1 flagellar protein FliT [Halomonas venusta]